MQHLQLFDVQVYSSWSGSNLAFGKSANQSTTREDSTIASNAIDGDEYSFSLTRDDDPHSWWEVDLGSIFEVKDVYIGLHSCRHGPENEIYFCYCHLGGANITLLDDSDEAIAIYTLEMRCSKRHMISFQSSSEYCPQGQGTVQPTTQTTDIS